MVDDKKIKVVEELIQKAEGLAIKGSLQEAQAALREANSLDVSNPKLERAFKNLEDAESGKPLVALCEKWLHSRSDDDGEIALDYLHKHSVAENWASEAMKVMMEYHGDLDMADQITEYLLKSKGARKLLALRMIEAPTITYRNIYERGDDSMKALSSILLESSNWPTEEDRIAAERDVFQLDLAQMMKAGEDHTERAMTSIARLLAVEASHLKGLIDSDGFNIILDQLDIRLPASLRSQATIATSKLFELATDSAEGLIAEYVVSRVKKPTADSLILSFSAASAVFPMDPPAATNLFVSDGFLPNMIKLVKKWKSKPLYQAALNLLDSACMNKECRDGIRKHCIDWVADLAENFSDQKKSIQARKILVKLKADEQQGEQNSGGNSKSRSQDPDQQVNSFKSIVLAGANDQDMLDALEALGILSFTHASVREKLGSDQDFLVAIAKQIDKKETMFLALQVIANLVLYRPRVSEEEEQMAKIKAWANNKRVPPPNPLDDDAHVNKRAAKVLEAKVVSHIVKSFPNFTNRCSVLAANIINGLAFHQPTRGKLVQQGAVRVLVGIWKAADLYTNETDKSNTQLASAHALARILIVTDPTVYFTGSAGASDLLASTANMLQQLIQYEPPPDTPRDWLPIYEALMAVTNLASLDNNTFKESIASSSFEKLEDLLFCKNLRVQTRAAELLCNITYTATVVRKYSPPEPGAEKRMEILVALCTAEMKATRMASLAILCMLTEASDPCAQNLIHSAKITRMLTRMLEPEPEDLKLPPTERFGTEEQSRVLYLIRTLVCNSQPEISVFAVQLLQEEGVVEKMKELLGRTKDAEVREQLRKWILPAMLVGDKGMGVKKIEGSSGKENVR